MLMKSVPIPVGEIYVPARLRQTLDPQRVLQIRPGSSGRIASRRLDLDDARTLVGEHHACIGPGKHLRQIDDEEALESASGSVLHGHLFAQWLFLFRSTRRSASTHSLSS